MIENKRLTLKQEEFTKEYVSNHGNGTQAALKTYDTVDAATAAAIATENLKKTHMRVAIDELKNGIRDGIVAGLAKAVESANASLQSSNPKEIAEARKFLLECAKFVFQPQSAPEENKPIKFTIPHR